MPTPVNFSLIKSCPQVWDAMPACAGGRKCGACDHVIRDFRGMSGMQIASVFAEAEGKVCGLYDEATLRPKVRRRWLSTERWGVVLAGLVGVLSPKPVAAQAERMHVSMPDSAGATVDEPGPRTAATERPPRPRSFHLVGTVRDERGERVIGASVLVDGTDHGAVTDFHGHYELNLGEQLGRDSALTVVGILIGSGQANHRVSRADFGTETLLRLDIDLPAPEPTVIYFGVSRNMDYKVAEGSEGERVSWVKRVWRRVKSIF